MVLKEEWSLGREFIYMEIQQERFLTKTNKKVDLKERCTLVKLVRGTSTWKFDRKGFLKKKRAVSYTHLRAHET